jgi:hypothetical protein
VGLHFVAALFIGGQKLAQIAIGPALGSEEIGDKLRGCGHEVVSRRAVNGQGTLAIFKPGGFDERGKISAVIDVEVSEQQDIELGHLGPALSKAECAASSRIHEHARLAVLPNEVARRRALVLEFRPAGAEHLEGYTVRAAGLRRGEGSDRNTEKNTNQRKKPDPGGVHVQWPQGGLSVAEYIASKDCGEGVRLVGAGGGVVGSRDAHRAPGSVRDCGSLRNGFVSGGA